MAKLDTPQKLREHLSVSRETTDKLEIYGEKIAQWQKAVNLVAPRTLPDIWHRHFADSLQMAGLIPPDVKTYADFGSGGGFPGLVLSIYLRENRTGVKTWLVESDLRKAAFLREVARSVENPVQILSTRIEASATRNAIGAVDLISARALAPLDRLCALVHPFCHASTTCLFLKGRGVAEEIEKARDQWAFDAELKQSQTDEGGRILILRNLRPIA